MKKSVKILLLVVMIASIISTFSANAFAAKDGDFLSSDNWYNNNFATFENKVVDGAYRMPCSANYKYGIDATAYNSVRTRLNFAEMVPETGEVNSRMTIMFMPDANGSSYSHWDWTLNRGIYVLVTKSDVGGNYYNVSVGRHTGGGFNHHKGTEMSGSRLITTIEADSFDDDVIISIVNTDHGTEVYFDDILLATIDVGFAAIFDTNNIYLQFGSYGQAVCSLKSYNYSAEKTGVSVNENTFYIDYDAEYIGKALIIFAEFSGECDVYGIVISDGVNEYEFLGKKNTDGKFGIALYNIPNGSYTVSAFADEAVSVSVNATVA